MSVSRRLSCEYTISRQEAEQRMRNRRKQEWKDWSALCYFRLHWVRDGSQVSDAPFHRRTSMAYRMRDRRNSELAWFDRRQRIDQKEHEIAELLKTWLEFAQGWIGGTWEQIGKWGEGKRERGERDRREDRKNRGESGTPVSTLSSSNQVGQRYTEVRAKDLLQKQEVSEQVKEKCWG